MNRPFGVPALAGFAWVVTDRLKPGHHTVRGPNACAKADGGYP